MARPVASELTNRMRPIPSPVSRPVTTFVDVLVPVALDQAYSYRVPDGTRARAGRPGVGAARRRARRPAWSGPTMSRSSPRLAQPPEGRRGQARPSAAQAGAAQVRRLGLGLHAQPARHGAAHGAAHGRASRSRARARRRAARRPAPQAHDRGARPRAGAARRWAGARQERGSRTTPASRAGVDRRPGRRRHARDPGAAARAGGARRPIPTSRSPDFTPAQRAAADALRATVAKGGYARHAARRRHRLGQDRRSISRRSARPSGAAGRRWS